MSLEIKPKISVLLVVYNESKHIERALNSVYEQTLCKKDIELLIIDGGSTDSTLSLCRTFSDKYLAGFYDIKLLKNPNKILASGWNIGIKNSTAEYVVRFDGHSTLAPTYLQNGLSSINSSSDAVACVGGWMNHKSDSAFGNYASLFYSSVIGGGSASFRREPRDIIKSDTALFAVYKKKFLLEVGLFNESLTRNQDIDLHKRLKSAGYHFLTSPELQVVYYVRASFKQLLKKAWKDGFWVGASQGFLLRHLVPLFFTLYIFTAIIIQYQFIHYTIVQCVWLPLIFYCSAIIFDLKLKKAQLLESIISIPIFFLYHLFYGVGTLIGLFRKIKL